MSLSCEGSAGELYCGDALDVLKTLPDGCADAIVTDPPSGTHFMGLAFDHNKGGRDQWIAWLAGIMAEARRVIKPGGYALVWALPRTSHWTAMALEDAGWTIRDSVAHLFGSGFPKSQSCLKPAHEVWWLAKAPGPLQPLQIDAARVPTGERYAYTRTGGSAIHRGGMDTERAAESHPGGRWPPNTLFSHVGGPDGCQPTGVRRVPADKRGQGRPQGTFPHSDDAWGNGPPTDTGAETAGDGTQAQQEYLCVEGCPIKALDEQAGPRTSGANTASHNKPTPGWGFKGTATGHWPANTGSASRFFPTLGPDPQDVVPFRYVPKAPARERRLADGTPTGHPTQKPAALAQWLASLICQPGGTVLDPFAGVGSLGVGALRAGCHYVGIEQDAGYAAMARRRLAEEQEQHSGPLFTGVSAVSAR